MRRSRTTTTPTSPARRSCSRPSGRSPAPSRGSASRGDGDDLGTPGREQAAIPRAVTLVDGEAGLREEVIQRLRPHEPQRAAAHAVRLPRPAGVGLAERDELALDVLDLAPHADTGAGGILDLDDVVRRPG